MNEKGNVIRAGIGELLFIFGMFLLLVMWDPLYVIVASLINAESMFMGDTIIFLIQLVPIIVAITGIALLAMEAYGGSVY